MEIKLIKGHGSGNEFYIIDEIEGNYSFSEDDRKEIAISLCDKLGELGADGILFLLKSETSQGRMRIFNADGSEAEMCGNGLRLIGRYVMEKLQRDNVAIDTMKARYELKRCKDIYEGVFTVEVPIDTIDFAPSAMPINFTKEKLLFENLKELSDKYSFSAVSITNPHLVSIVSEIDDVDLTEIGIKANNTKELFPKGTNVNFLKLLSEDSIFVRTYERGVGLTPSCGTGMIASSVIASINNKNLEGKNLKVVNQGGMILCTVRRKKDNNITVNFKGNATYIYSTAIDYNKGNFSIAKDKESFFEEGLNYEEFLKEIKNKFN